MNIVPGRFNALRPGCRTQPFTEIRPSRACFHSDNLLDVTCRIDTESRLRASLHRCHRSTNRGPTCRAVQSATSPPLGSAESLVAWLEQCGVPWDKNAARPSFNEGGPALVANRTAAGGSSLLTVPESAWVTTDVVAKSMIGKEVKGLEPWLQIALFLVAERAAPTSQFKPYISSLPNKPNLLTFWSDSELRELEGTQLLESLEGYKYAHFAISPDIWLFVSQESYLFLSQMCRGMLKVMMCFCSSLSILGPGHVAAVQRSVAMATVMICSAQSMFNTRYCFHRL